MKIFTRPRPDGTFTMLWPIAGAAGNGRRMTAGNRCTATVSDPQALVRALDSSARFRRDSGFGAIYHRGKVSYRELSPTNSIHIVIDGNRLSAHVDRISPLKRRADGSSRYSMARVVAHNVSGIGEDVTRRISGRRPR